jgi:hypothetical protein
MDDAQAQWVGPSLGQQLGLGTPAPRLTHAEQAQQRLVSGWGWISQENADHLAHAAAIEWVAREVVDGWNGYRGAAHLEELIGRLRALVQP